jgi:hypothetical protein
MEEIARVLNQVQQELLAMRQRFDALEGAPNPVANPPATPAAPNGTPPPRPAKVNDPEEFKGERSKARAFVLQCQNKFMGERNRFPDENSKVRYAISYLRGAAFKWITPYLEYESTHPDQEPPVILRTSQNFFAELVRIFDDPNRQKNAEDQLFSIKQGKRSVTALVSQFQCLVIEAGFKFDNPSLFGIFYKALNDEVKDELIKQARPTKLDEYFLAAINIDDRLHQRRQERNANRSTPRQNNGGSNNSSSSQSSGPTPMEIDATSNQPRGRLTEAEKQRRRANNLCLYCGSADHKVKNCNIRPSTVAATSTNGSSPSAASSSNSKTSSN